MECTKSTVIRPRYALYERNHWAKETNQMVKPKPKPPPLTVVVDGKTFTTRAAFDTFWKYTSERHAIEEKRRAGKPQPWSSKRVFREYKFCSIFRVADRGSQFLIKEVIEKGSQRPQEILFRVLLYSSFVKPETYTLLSSRLGPLTWASYNRAAYSIVLQAALDADVAIYTAAFQKFPPHLGQHVAHENHLSLLEVMMGNGLLEQLEDARYMADAFDALWAFPGSGNFVAFQLLINLSYTPLLNFGENDFVVAGVGAVAGLKKCFAPAESVSGSEAALIRWMMETQDEQFERLGLEPARLGEEGRAMTLVDVEHTLCEVHKYVRITGGSEVGSGYGKKFTVQTTRLPRQPTLPAAWSHPARERIRRRPGVDTARGMKVYVVNAILDRRAVDDDESDNDEEEEEVEYLVDWLGYPATSRTWEPGETLWLDAPRMVEEYERAHPREGGAGPTRKKRRA